MKKTLIKNKFFYYFYKLLKIQRNKKPSIHYGEFGEDISVNRILKDIKIGKYVDVGCYHPFKGSLTVQLYNRGWKGINIDLSKSSIDLFNLTRKKDINLNLAVSDFDGQTNYYENSPINQQNSLIKDNDSQKKIKIECRSLNSILEQNKFQNFEYLNIDVEGSEEKVIEGIDLTKFRPILITIENNNLHIKDYMNSKIYNILIKNDYIFIGKTGVTNFFLINQHAKNFSNLIKI
jgi:FkbM family methyltransferase